MSSGHAYFRFDLSWPTIFGIAIVKLAKFVAFKKEGIMGKLFGLIRLIGMISLISMPLSSSSWASPEIALDELNASITPLHTCFRDHLREAIRINETRRPLYARLSHNQSLEISNELIFLEKVAVLGSYTLANFDLAAKDFQEANIPIVCSEYVSMVSTPPFRDHFESGAPHLKNFAPTNPGRLTSLLSDAKAHGGLQVLYETLKGEIQKLKTEPRFHCMIRHILDSMARVAALAPIHESSARAKGLRSPMGLTEKMLEAHLMLLEPAANLDRLAAPLQAMGLPIICQDVPHIPVPRYGQHAGLSQ
jgi:hypothetical protein